MCQVPPHPQNLHLCSLHGGSWRGCSHCCGHCRGRQRGCEGLHGKRYAPQWLAAILAFIGIENFTTTLHNVNLLGFNPSETWCCKNEVQNHYPSAASKLRTTLVLQNSLLSTREKRWPNHQPSRTIPMYTLKIIEMLETAVFQSSPLQSVPLCVCFVNSLPGLGRLAFGSWRANHTARAWFDTSPVSGELVSNTSRTCCIMCPIFTLNV